MGVEPLFDWRQLYRFRISLVLLLMAGIGTGLFFEVTNRPVYEATIVIRPPLEATWQCAGDQADDTCGISQRGEALFAWYIQVAKDEEVKSAFARHDSLPVLPSQAGECIHLYHNIPRNQVLLRMRCAGQAALPGLLQDYLAYVRAQAIHDLSGVNALCDGLPGRQCSADGQTFYRVKDDVSVKNISPRTGLRLLLALPCSVLAWCAWVLFCLWLDTGRRPGQGDAA